MPPDTLARILLAVRRVLVPEGTCRTLMDATPFEAEG